MELDILGSGEAYDSQRVNAAIRVSENGFQLLVDCGPTVPQALWQRQTAPDDLNAIYITHAHPDHVLGLTTWLNWCESCGRTAPLTIIAPRAQQQQLRQLADFAFWPTGRPLFTLHWQDSESLSELGPWHCQTAPTRHSVPNRALYLSGKQGSLFYSGDGQLTAASADLLSGADLALVECFSPQATGNAWHGNWPQVQTLARKPGAQLGLYHVQQSQKAALQQAIAASSAIFLPEQGDRAHCHDGHWHIIGGSGHE
ncbi:beta-lactamase superfamily hydrolase [Dickeya parazeae Ech586]|uniref:Beta-lactamase superfamily hydrolase n=1 Tax=Dickeya zeae (strain Ech586) TaxID=590409 RepID=D2BT93_DICZ5|nr:ribonuclease Z [Dickeya parazeae]ACZ75730.1 beta-lactamase superfamily hydrolase [Dickeya parazeae Ech586]